MKNLSGEKILVVDDEAVVHEIIGHYLKKEGFQVINATNGSEAIQAAHLYKPDLVLLDVLMPKLDGIKVCQEIRKHVEIPILFVTSKDQSYDLAQGFGAGADDYIKKPFDPVEVIIRVRTHLHRYQQFRILKDKSMQSQVMEFAGLKIDLLNHTVEVNDTPILLTLKEFELLSVLAKNPNRFLKSNQLIELVWDNPDSVDYRSLMVHMSNLRKKIEPNPSNPIYIISLRGYGYKLNTSGK